jgi:hypothetical protein
VLPVWKRSAINLVMASSILVRAKNLIERSKARTQRVARENQHTTVLVSGGIAATGVAVAAAYADQKMGDGQQWKVGAFPVVGIAGAAMLVPAFFSKKMPIVQAASVAAGTTAINLAIYRYLIEDGIKPGEPG